MSLAKHAVSFLRLAFHESNRAKNILLVRLHHGAVLHHLIYQEVHFLELVEYVELTYVGQMLARVNLRKRRTYQIDLLGSESDDGAMS